MIETRDKKTKSANSSHYIVQTFVGDQVLKNQIVSFCFLVEAKRSFFEFNTTREQFLETIFFSIARLIVG